MDLTLILKLENSKEFLVDFKSLIAIDRVVQQRSVEFKTKLKAQ